jgi:hypothetical protein
MAASVPRPIPRGPSGPPGATLGGLIRLIEFSPAALSVFLVEPSAMTGRRRRSR